MAFVAACRAEVLSERTISFYLEALNSDRVLLRVGRLLLAELARDTLGRSERSRHGIGDHIAVVVDRGG